MSGITRSLAALGLLFAATIVAAEEVTFDLRIEGGRLPPAMRLIRVKQSDVVRLRWTTDRPIALHLHGYDIEATIEPGTATEMVFTARATGRFPIAPHVGKQASGGHAHGSVLATIEVHPR